MPYTNASGYRNPDVDALFDAQRVQLDLPTRKATYGKIQELIWADVPVLPMFAYDAPNVYRNTVVTGLYEGSYGNQESFAAAKPPAKPVAAPAPEAAATHDWTIPAVAAAVAVVAGGAWAKRRGRKPDAP
jgi:ABC-type transport system substrate-binding protein